MIRKVFYTLIILMLGQITFAKEITIYIYAPQKITTSNINLREGDSVNFKIAEDVYKNSKLYLKKDETVNGIITNMVENGFMCEPATILVENFRTKSAIGESVKLKGEIHSKGRTHWMFTQFLPLIPDLIRGGEVQIKSGTTYKLFLDEKL